MTPTSQNFNPFSQQPNQLHHVQQNLPLQLLLIQTVNNPLPQLLMSSNAIAIHAALLLARTFTFQEPALRQTITMSLHATGLIVQSSLALLPLETVEEA